MSQAGGRHPASLFVSPSSESVPLLFNVVVVSAVQYFISPSEQPDSVTARKRRRGEGTRLALSERAAEGTFKPKCGNRGQIIQGRILVSRRT